MVVLVVAAKNVDQLIPVIAAAAVGVLDTDAGDLSVVCVACPFCLLVAGQPAKIIAVAVRHGVAAAVEPDICTDTLVLGHMQLQGVVAHPRHLADQVFDPLHGPVFSCAVEHERAFLCVRLVLDGAGGDLQASIDLKMADSHKGTVEKAVHIAGTDGKTVGGDGQTVAVGGETVRQFQNNVARQRPLAVAPDKGQGPGRGQSGGGKFGVDQLGGPEQLTCRFGIGGHK